MGCRRGRRSVKRHERRLRGRGGPHRGHGAGTGRDSMTDAAAPEERFAQDWTAEILPKAPLIAPARQFIYPQQIAGEEDALARGALQVLVRPTAGGTFLATCALGFPDPSM